MRNKGIFLAGALAVSALAAAAQGPAAGAAPADSAAAAIATVWAEHLRPSMVRQLTDIEGLGVDIDREAFFRYLGAALGGTRVGFTPQEADAYMNRRVQSVSAGDSVYVQEQQAWIEQKKQIPGVTVTPDGLVFEVVIEGEGPNPTKDDTVTVNYVGRLSDGTEFDNTNGHPATFPVGRLIPGFTEGLTMMKPGGTYRLYIPAELGYGSRGAGRKIKPGAALDFTVELVSIAPRQ